MTNGVSTGLTKAANKRQASQWTPREVELLAVTLRLLQQHGYDRLSVDEVAAESKASKATIYRRWPSKAELVLAAFIEGMRAQLIRPNTGSLREDLLQIGMNALADVRRNTPVMRGLLIEIERNPDLTKAFRTKFIDQRKLLLDDVLTAAVERGEIEAAAINEELWDLLPGYLVFRSLMPVRSPTANTVRTLVNDVIMPSLTRKL
ncbi:TetR/AcrR family transcriptional regulator [Mycobacteroides chelonae]|uniref:TetR/AcrR family transcriptional regulator n=1 Tax=Mycobacteroides chelonae TaxID=1774 RepID=UPI00096A7381|nr:TetR/AcrR family transcriptional regulator [Mycobacteroides chelonae]MBF9350762.1 TetR/AcrR family transcriptional regulator [Mycobacteroides chelonae]MEC4838817.1 TetR/AcrR family transcriptional regulator [Mycobacteroides chelonae]MEC4845078.1 TetR/AcrR family transcriptional regulator [Mycobacteroides chelonae]WED89908.1 TetR/AcrR family transcriptional regulator [Mycobacteroides chelonae]WED97870.1 TetR/AcrR family transcriptional regulator [Mycobacteroides chelonae]